MRPDSYAAGPASLTTVPDRFSDAAWDLLLASQEQARRWRHGEMNVEHLLQVLLNDERYAAWVDPLPLDASRLLDQLDDFCADNPPAAPGISSLARTWNCSWRRPTASGASGAHASSMFPISWRPCWTTAASRAPSCNSRG